MKRLKRSVCNENGSVLLISVVILMLLTVLGIFATTTSTIEVQIAGNDKWHKMAFYAADGGTEAGIALLEENIFSAGFNDDDGSGNFINGDISGSSLNFYMLDEPSDPNPSDSNRVAFMPVGYGNQPHTNLLIGGNTSLSTGSAMQMAAGYEGSGKGAAGSGAQITYDIYSQRIGQDNSESTVKMQWRHIM